jgi:hypothetical protein
VFEFEAVDDDLSVSGRGEVQACEDEQEQKERADDGGH